MLVSSCFRLHAYSRQGPTTNSDAHCCTLTHAPLHANSQVRLVYANQTEADILLREELDAMAAARPDAFKLYYTCDR